MSEPETPPKLQVLIVGSGKLARELLEGLAGPHIHSVLPWAEREAAWSGRRVVVHAGSGREMADVLSFCARHQLVLIELATTGALAGIEPSFPVVICANTNILMLKFMAMLHAQGHLFAGYDIRVLESHQASKKSAPGTAISLARALNVPTEEIVSVRDPLAQEQLGIPAHHHARHAYHHITITDGAVELVLETKVLGQTPYAAGLAGIVDAVRARNLEPRTYDVLELIHNGWI